MKTGDITILAEDTTCEVWCECGWAPFIASDYVYRCPNCGRGYRTEFLVHRYEAGEIDAEHQDRPAISAYKLRELPEAPQSEADNR